MLLFFNHETRTTLVIHTIYRVYTKCTCMLLYSHRNIEGGWFRVAFRVLGLTEGCFLMVVHRHRVAGRSTAAGFTHAPSFAPPPPLPYLRTPSLLDSLAFHRDAALHSAMLEARLRFLCALKAEYFKAKREGKLGSSGKLLKEKKT